MHFSPEGPGGAGPAQGRGTGAGEPRGPGTGTPAALVRTHPSSPVAEAPGQRPSTVVFDLGGVVIDWNPRYLYRKLIPDPAALDRFLTDVCSMAWNKQMDFGRPFAEAVAELTARHPDQSHLIEAYHARWAEMLGGLVPGVAEVLEELAEAGVPLYAITNWSAETFPFATARYPVLSMFSKIVISGEIGLTKPDPEIFRYAAEQFGVPLQECLFVDDARINVASARAVGMRAVRFVDADTLRADLRGHQLLP